MESAPFFSTIADGPEDGAAWWLNTEDGVRIRVGLWNRDAPSGTVLLFPGRTEYIEKYGRTARLLADRGLATLAIDWRGQGIADRLVEDPATGHVHWFSDYQHDVQAMVAAARALALPEHFHLMAHSMGGCIGLRAIYDCMPVKAVAFSAPMWGIKMQSAMRPLAWTLGTLAPRVGMGGKMTPTTSKITYVMEAAFEGNLLTRDRAMFELMVRQLTTHPDLAIGGPTLQWLGQALLETRALMAMDPPGLPCLTVLGINERIVHIEAIKRRMATWPGAEFDLIPDAEHELMMEVPVVRNRFFDKAAALFDAHR